MTGLGNWPPKIDWSAPWQSPDFPPPIPERCPPLSFASGGSSKGNNDVQKKQDGRQLSGPKKAGRKRGRRR